MEAVTLRGNSQSRVDNSEWSRNGDFAPSRFDAQVETVNFLSSAKIQSNPETTVGLVSMAGTRIQVHISPTRMPGQIMTALAKDVKIEGESNFVGALKTSSLALKNRQNKNQRQRIILFVGSPISDDTRELVKLGKLLKKNNVAVDVINFGSENASNENAEKCEAFISAVNASDNSHLIHVPPGPHILSDMVLSSVIMMEGGGNGSGGGSSGGAGSRGGGAVGGSGVGGFGDIDPNLEPELAMAIRMSMEEERARQARINAQTTTTTSSSTEEKKQELATSTTTTASTINENVSMEDDEESLLAQAIAMSMQTEPESTSAGDSSSSSTSTNPSSATTSSHPTSSIVDTATIDADIDAAMQDPDFINSLLASADDNPPTDHNQAGNEGKNNEKDEKKEEKKE